MNCPCKCEIEEPGDSIRKKREHNMITIIYEKDNNCAAAYGGQGIARKMVECVKEAAEAAQVTLEATCWYAKKVLG